MPKKPDTSPLICPGCCRRHTRGAIARYRKETRFYGFTCPCGYEYPDGGRPLSVNEILAGGSFYVYLDNAAPFLVAFAEAYAEGLAAQLEAQRERVVRRLGGGPCSIAYDVETNTYSAWWRREYHCELSDQRPGPGGTIEATSLPDLYRQILDWEDEADREDLERDDICPECRAEMEAAANA